jgi:predicted PurR-regulated permease PerM
MRIPGWIVALLVIAAGLIVVPFAPWALLAVWLGLYARKVYEPLTRRLGGRRQLAATITVSLLAVVVIPIAIVVTSIVIDAIALVQRLMESEQTQAVLEKLVQGNGEPKPDASAMDSATGIADLVLNQGDRAWEVARKLAGAAAHFVIGLLVMVTGMYGVLVHGSSWYAWIERHAPMAPEHVARFGGVFIETGRGLWFGIVGAGLLQSVIATVTYLVIGVPSALALGMLTLLFSVIPAIGTALVWVPVAAGLAITGRTTAAIILAGIGVAVIGTIDNLARPWLAQRGELRLPSWVVLVAMFGGIELIGGWGLVIGPLVVRLAKEALAIRAEGADLARSGEAVETPDGT